MGFLDDRNEKRPIHCAHLTQVRDKNFFFLIPKAQFLLFKYLSITLSGDNYNVKLTTLVFWF